MAVEFVLSAYGAAQFPRDRLPEIAFVGPGATSESRVCSTRCSCGAESAHGEGRR